MKVCANVRSPLLHKLLCEAGRYAQNIVYSKAPRTNSIVDQIVQDYPQPQDEVHCTACYACTASAWADRSKLMLTQAHDQAKVAAAELAIAAACRKSR